MPIQAVGAAKNVADNVVDYEDDDAFNSVFVKRGKR